MVIFRHDPDHGSSTVAPLTQAIAEGFNEENPNVDVTVGTSGTGGGFEKFCAGETDANDASEAIGDEEIAACQQGGVEHAELRVATTRSPWSPTPRTRSPA